MNKKLIIILSLLIISAVINIVLLTGKKTTSAEVYRMDTDNRISVKVKPEHKAFVMNEMRLFIESLQMVNEGINKNDPELIIRAAEQSGTSVHAPKDMIPLIPEGFMKMGGPTHKLFDIMADSARTNFNPELARNSSPCSSTTAFHATRHIEWIYCHSNKPKLPSRQRAPQHSNCVKSTP